MYADDTSITLGGEDAYQLLEDLRNELQDITDWLRQNKLKGLFHPACLARVVSWFAFLVAIFMAHENGDKQRPVK